VQLQIFGRDLQKPGRHSQFGGEDLSEDGVLALAER
jgi:hypothetical protein